MIERTRLPTFLVLGTNKAGTTTLHAALQAHPQVFLPFRKEIHFFNDDLNYARGVRWYVDTFYQGAERWPARGDITPACLYFGERVIPRLVQVYGDRPPRMIAILRDPVERAWSRYWHARRLAREEPLSFEDALAAEERRLAEDSTTWSRRGRFRHAYFHGGLYGEQLERYYAHFPREALHVMFLEDLARDFAATIADLFRFIGVDPQVPVPPRRRNEAAAGRAPALEGWIRSQTQVGRLIRPMLSPRMLSFARKALRWPFRTRSGYPRMDRGTEQALRRWYRPDVQKLEMLTGRDLSHWYPTDGPA